MQPRSRDDPEAKLDQKRDENAGYQPFDRTAEERLREVKRLQSVDVEDQEDSRDLDRDKRDEDLP